jgi:hypothetical protein
MSLLPGIAQPDQIQRQMLTRAPAVRLNMRVISVISFGDYSRLIAGDSEQILKFLSSALSPHGGYETSNSAQAIILTC